MDKDYITFPRMGIYTQSFENLFKNLGCNILTPPEITQKTIKLGVKHSSDMICFPYKVTLGNMIESLEKGAKKIIMFDTCGTCRFRHYWKIQEFTLKRLGYDFEMVAVNWKNILFKFRKLSNTSYLRLLKETKTFWRDIKKRELEFYGHTGDFFKIDENKINIGLVGEVYTLWENSINYNIIDKLKRLNVKPHLSVLLSDFIKHSFLGDNKKEKKEARNYINKKIGGHGLHSIYNSLWYANNNFDAVIHMLPLSCMPESTVEPIIDNTCKIPVYRFPIDENRFEAGFNTRIETFVSLLRKRKKCKIVG